MRRSLPFLFLLLAGTCLAASPIIELPKRATLRFIVTGDAGSTHSQLREGMLAVMKRTPIDGILLVGDNFYPCGVASVDDPQWTKITDISVRPICRFTRSSAITITAISSSAADRTTGRAAIRIRKPR